MGKPYFSVVIPTLDEEVCLPDLLGDLSFQTFKDFEVIHVDGNSDDKTVYRAKGFKRKIKLKSFVVNIRNVGYQRNFGAKKSKGEWVVFMDADVRFDKDFLEDLYTKLQNSDVGIFSCELDLKTYDKKDRKYISLINSALKVAKYTKPQAMGSMLGVRRSATNKLSYDEKINNGEDRKYIDDFVSSGYKYDLFSSPRYHFSLRRFKKEGYVKMLAIAAQHTLMYLTGVNYENNKKHYPMAGGKYYRD